jgi:hypothetical protein
MQLGTWAIWSNLAVSFHQRTLLDFLNMGVYHLSVLIWFYYVLTTKATLGSTRIMDNLGDDGHYDDHDSGRADSGGHDSGGEDSEVEEERQHDLVVWNRELERLLKR